MSKLENGVLQISHISPIEDVAHRVFRDTDPSVNEVKGRRRSSYILKYRVCYSKGTLERQEFGADESFIEDAVVDVIPIERVIGHFTVDFHAMEQGIRCAISVARRGSQNHDWPGHRSDAMS